ncbi:lysozyme inhibitor LprI family protein [uncultured Pseudodesulfovibrio sp.]|uniref:lysozyme inhibitor LprI family protein n=1 Tax=uncultured Pseudodesulfovibrio sp. TaxID=2035858 RepID=UPI0029C732B6|nr:lysozyme inhibitor LprI family protein [uncultured Pseudodesulfovibrio sp.]
MRLRFLTGNRVWLGLLLCLAISFSALAQPSSSENDPFFNCSMAEVDQEMAATLDMIKVEYADYPLFLTRLEEAQLAWEAYRDAFLLSLYPEPDVRLKYGRVFDACWCSNYTAKTKERIKELQRWLDKVEEGDVCSGSVRFK